MTWLLTVECRSTTKMIRMGLNRWLISRIRGRGRGHDWFDGGWTSRVRPINKRGLRLSTSPMKINENMFNIFNSIRMGAFKRKKNKQNMLLPAWGFLWASSGSSGPPPPPEEEHVLNVPSYYSSGGEAKKKNQNKRGNSIAHDRKPETQQWRLFASSGFRCGGVINRSPAPPFWMTSLELRIKLSIDC